MKRLTSAMKINELGTNANEECGPLTALETKEHKAIMTARMGCGSGSAATPGNRCLTLCLAALLLGSASSDLSAQLVADGSILNLTTTTNLLLDDLVVGTNGGNTVLNIIGPGGTLTNARAYIGLNVSSTSNRVAVQNTGANWTSTFLNVGYSGAGNTLLITNRGTAQSTTGTLGFNADSSNNRAVVTGEGSTWTISLDLGIGKAGEGNSLLISDGALVQSGDVMFGTSAGSISNHAIVTDPGSTWISSGSITLGGSGSGNMLVITNGAEVQSYSGVLGSSASNNRAVITGPLSIWTNTSGFTVGVGGVGNLLLITNGAIATCTTGDIGVFPPASSNQVVVTGPGSLWNIGTDLDIGWIGSHSTLLISNGASVAVGTSTLIGANAGSSMNLLHLEGGSLTVGDNLEVRHGTLRLESGTVTAGALLATNGADGMIVFSGGTLSVTNSTISTGESLVVGNGSSAAIYQLLDNGLHSFDDGFTIGNNALLEGNGTIAGTLTVQIGANVSVGASTGMLVLSNPPVLQGAVLMEIGKSNSTLTNDQIQVADALTYGGSLVITNLGPDALEFGDSFSLFSASSYDGALSSITLPSLDPGLSWTNRLLVDGSIAVVSQSPPEIRSATRSASNLVFNVTGGPPGGYCDLLTSTNVALPLPTWTTNSSGVFDWLGNLPVSTAIDSTEPERYFRIGIP